MNRVVRHPTISDAWLLIDFGIDSDQLQPEHETWLSSEVVLRKCRTQYVGLKGRASRTGNADHNLDLSIRREAEVEAFLIAQGVPMDRIGECTGVGETDSRGGPEENAFWRSVEVRFAGLPQPTPRRRHRRQAGARRIVWTPVTPETVPPQWTIARNDDTPVETPGAAGTAIILRALDLLADYALNVAIERELRQKDREAGRYLTGHRNGGILAWVRVFVTFDPSFAAFGLSRPGARPVRYDGAVSRRVESIIIDSQVYSEPMHALSVARYRRRATVSRGPGDNQYEDDPRYYWGQWANQRTPTR